VFVPTVSTLSFFTQNGVKTQGTSKLDYTFEKSYPQNQCLNKSETKCILMAENRTVFPNPFPWRNTQNNFSYSEEQKPITTDIQQRNVTLNRNRQNESNGTVGDTRRLLQYCQLLDKILVIFHGTFGTFHEISNCIFIYLFMYLFIHSFTSQYLTQPWLWNTGTVFFILKGSSPLACIQ